MLICFFIKIFYKFSFIFHSVIKDENIKFYFFLGCVGLLALNSSSYLNLMSGIASSFGGNQNIVRIQGMAMSGFSTNIIALGCTYFANKVSLRLQFFIYLLVGDVILIFFYVQKVKFFNSIKDQSVFQSKNQKQKKAKLTDFELQSLDEPFKTKSNQHETKKIISVFTIIKERWIDYLNILLAFGTCLACFPTLIFQFDISEIVSFSYKFIFISFVFNFGDIAGRFAIEYLVVSSKVNNILSLFKILLVFVSYSVLSNPESATLQNLYVKLLLMFWNGFLTGYIPCASFVYSRNFYKGKPEH